MTIAFTIPHWVLWSLGVLALIPILFFAVVGFIFLGSFRGPNW